VGERSDRWYRPLKVGVNGRTVAEHVWRQGGTVGPLGSTSAACSTSRPTSPGTRSGSAPPS
jgi:hypothetical protein